MVIRRRALISERSHQACMGPALQARRIGQAVVPTYGYRGCCCRCPDAPCPAYSNLSLRRGHHHLLASRAYAHARPPRASSVPKPTAVHELMPFLLYDSAVQAWRARARRRAHWRTCSLPLARSWWVGRGSGALSVVGCGTVGPWDCRRVSAA